MDEHKIEIGSEWVSKIDGLKWYCATVKYIGNSKLFVEWRRELNNDEVTSEQSFTIVNFLRQFKPKTVERVVIKDNNDE